jgi:hypothetical protein
LGPGLRQTRFAGSPPPVFRPATVAGRAARVRRDMAWPRAGDRRASARRPTGREQPRKATDWRDHKHDGRTVTLFRLMIG